MHKDGLRRSRTLYNQAMTHGKLSKEEIKALEAQIKHDQKQPIKPAEKRVKLNMPFEKAMRIITRTKPKRDNS